MSLLAGRPFIVQLTREKAEELIKERLKIRGTELQPPFQLRVPSPSSADYFVTEALVDIVFRNVHLALTPGADTADLRLEIEAGVVRPDGVPPIPLRTGELWITLRFAESNVLAPKLSVQPLTATLHGVDHLGAMLALANAAVNKVLDEDRGESTDLLSMKLPTQFTRALDAETLVVYAGAPNVPDVERFVGIRDIAVALSAAQTRERILCPAMVPPELQGQAVQDVLPAVCGTSGGLDKGTDGIDLLIKYIQFDFHEGYVRVSGTFDAGDTCWELRDGTFSQNIHLTFDAATGKVVPKLDPEQPHWDGEVEVLFVCEALSFIAGILVPRIGSVIVGLAFVVSLNLAVSLADPDVPEQTPQGADPRAFLPAAYWQALFIKEEGLLMQGLIAVPHFPAAYQPSGVSLSVRRQPMNVAEGPPGTTTHRMPPCEPQAFQYRKFSQDEEVVLQVQPRWLVSPLDCEWSINGVAIPPPNDGTLGFVTTVSTALPLPGGIPIPGHTVQLGYWFPGFVFASNRTALTLTARGADLNYTIDLKVKVTDAAGRVFSNGAYLTFRGEFVEFGQDYNDYVDECFRKFRKIVDKKVLVKTRLKPGEPEERVDWMVRYIQEHVDARSPHVAEIIDRGVALHGVAALNEALSKRAAAVMAKNKGLG